MLSLGLRGNSEWSLFDFSKSLWVCQFSPHWERTDVEFSVSSNFYSCPNPNPLEIT